MNNPFASELAFLDMKIGPKYSQFMIGLKESCAIRRKAGLSRLHIRSSELFASKCLQIEEEQKQLSWPQPRFDEVQSYASAAIIIAVAALESSINELYQQAIDRDRTSLKSLTIEHMVLLEQLWPDVERFSILKKYQIALTVKNSRAIEVGAEPYQSANSLVALRNGLVHFRPEWEDSLDKHLKLEKRLMKYIRPSCLTDETNLLWFPHKCLGSGSAIWAGTTAKEFSRVFCSMMGIKERL